MRKITKMDPALLLCILFFIFIYQASNCCIFFWTFCISFYIFYYISSYSAYYYMTNTQNIDPKKSFINVFYHHSGTASQATPRGYRLYSAGRFLWKQQLSSLLRHLARGTWPFGRRVVWKQQLSSLLRHLARGTWPCGGRFVWKQQLSSLLRHLARGTWPCGGPSPVEGDLWGSSSSSRFSDTWRVGRDRLEGELCCSSSSARFSDTCVTVWRAICEAAAAQLASPTLGVISNLGNSNFV